ncbi:hypothetical protein Z043-102630 [Arapaima gigas]
MNYIFGNGAFYPRGSRGHSTSGPRPRQWAKRDSAEEAPSRWQQLLAFFTRGGAFADCITAGASQDELLGFAVCVLYLLTDRSQSEERGALML